MIMVKGDVITTMERVLELQAQLNFSEDEFKDESVGVFEEWMLLHEQLLKAYQLPVTQHNLKIFEKLKGENCEGVIRLLEQRRTTYLLSSPVSFKTILEEGISDPSKADDVIGEMGLRNHCYVEFVYNDVWRAGNCTVEQAISELLLTKENPGSLNELGVLFYSEKLNEENARILKLKELGYEFIDKYVQYIRCVVRGEGVLIKRKK
jgi:hypothetical protein